MVSLSNLSKRCEGATVPAVAALTLPQPAQEKGKDGLFYSLLRISHHILIVLVSEKQSECFKSERFDELTLTKLIAIHYVYLRK